MVNYLDLILLKNENIDRNIISNSLFFSFDKISEIGRFSDISSLKKHDKYEVIDYIFKNLGEGFKEIKAIVKTNIKIFIRIVLDNDDLIYDILAYSILTNEDYDKYKKIFFSDKKIELDSYLSNIVDKSILIFNGKELTFVKNANTFLKNIKYEDWDFNNKHSSNLLYVIKDDIKYSLNEKKDFNSSITFKANGGADILLNVKFKYYSFNNNDFYIIEA